MGVNFFDVGRQHLHLRMLSAACHSYDAMIPTSQLQLPQSRQTCAVLGVQAEDDWGLQFGCNEHGVAIGVARWRSRLPAREPALTGPELTRLALERGHSALHAAEVLTDLIARYGQCGPDADAPDSVFLVADSGEACVLEVAGRCWALLECSHTRAVADVGLIRQDWQRLSPGLAEQAMQHGWWTDDGTKIDFAGILGQPDAAVAWPLKRWSKATLALAQHQGAMDDYLLRRLLADHHETCIRRHKLAPRATRHLASLVARLDSPGAPLVWFARGPVEAPLYLPLVAGVDMPAVLGMRSTADQPTAPRSLVERLQGQFDQEAEEYLTEARKLHLRGEVAACRRLAQAMMYRHVEQWEAATRRRLDAPAAVTGPMRDEEELAPYAFG